MWEAIKRLQQGESLKIQDVKTNLFWEFDKFTLHDGETMESYYTRFYRLLNEMIRNNLTVATMQVNVPFLQQLQPEWSRFVRIVKQQHKLDEVSYHKLFDILKQYQKEVNELCTKRLARNANPLALVATAQADQDPYYQTSRSHKSYAPSKPLIPTISHTTTRHKGKEIAKPITPLSETASEEDNDPEQAQRDKNNQKNLDLISKFFKKIYKPTNNNLRTSSNSRNKNEKMLLCKQAEQGVPLQAKQYDWLANTNKEVDEHELEAHYSYMAKIQEVPTADTGTDSGPVEQNDQNDVESNDERVALANLIANLKLNVDENKKIQKQLKKANTTLAQELKECKTILTETSKSLGESISVRDSCLVVHQDKQTEFDKYKAFNDRIIDYDKLELVKEKHDELIKHSLLTKSHYEGLVKQKTKAQSEIPCLYAFPYDQSTYANKLIPDEEETIALERESRLKLNKDLVRPYDHTTINSLYEIFKPPTQEYKMQLAYANEIKRKISISCPNCSRYGDPDSDMFKQEMHADLKCIESLEKEIDELESDKAEFSNMYDVILQVCMSNDVKCSYLMSLFDLDVLDELQCLYLHKVKECGCLAQKLSNQTNSVSKEVHSELLNRFAKVEKHSISLEIALQKRKEQKLTKKGKGKYVDTKFDKPSVVRQPNAQRIPRPSVLGKPAPFSNSLERIYFQKTKSVPKTNVSKGLLKPVTAHTLPQAARKAVNNTNVLKPGMYRINNRPQHKSNQLRDKVVPNNSQVKVKKTQVEFHPRIPSVSNRMKSVTTCKDSLNSRTLNVNAVYASCNKCLVDSNHFAYVTKMLNDVHARTKKPNVVPISTRKPKSQANKSVATPYKKKVASKSTNQKRQSYFRKLYEKTNKAWNWWIAQQSPPGYKWVPKTKMQWVPKAKNDHVQKRVLQLILFIVDSGCTKHMTGNSKLLCNFVERFLGTVRFGNDQFALILGYGDLVQGNVMINKVYYVKGLNHNLFSVGHFCDVGLEAFNDRTVDYDKLERKLNETLGQLAQKDIEIQEEIVDNAWIKHSKDQFCAPTTQDMEILIQACLMPLSLKTQNDSFIFVHELKQEMHADLKYVESLEKEIDELESDKAEFSNMYDMILQECKPAPFSDSLEKRYFSKTKSVPKTNVSEGLSKPVTAQTLPQTARQAIIQLIIFIVYSGCTKHTTGNLKLLCNFVEKFMGTVRFGNDQFAPIIGYGDLVQGNITNNRVYYVEGLNHNLISVGQFCDADLEVAFRKSTFFVRDLQGNDLLIDLFRAPTALDMEILIQICLTPLSIKTQGDSLKVVHELKQEMHVDLKYVESLEKAIEELESEKAEFSDMYDVILHDCVSKDVM
nr:integrase, catalytic region, zinc finger, CCHC-type, peptidase aspartic, catalytic [Tanacetum cinerariifolium]